MNKINKAFTLVELVVVVTILIILSAIAFISLQGYSRDAKNSKVSSDIRNLITAIELSNTKGNSTVPSLLDNNLNTNVNLPSGTFSSGSVTISDNSNSGIGGINFVELNQNGSDFKDNEENPRDYIYSYVASDSLSYYQIGGQITESSGNDKVIIKGNYVKRNGDVDGLIRGTNNTSGLENGDYDSVLNY